MALIALIHLGSGSVSGGLLDGAKIIYATQRKCQLREKLDTETFLESIRATLKEVLNDLLLTKRGVPTRVVVFLSSPFVAGRLYLLRQHADQAFVVNEKLINELVKRQTDQLLLDRHHLLIDSKIMRFRLNGYDVAAPHGQRANDLELAYYGSIAARDIFEKIKDTVKSTCHHEQIEFHSAAFVNFVVTRDLKPVTGRDFVLLELGGEVSELTLIWRGIIRETFSWPIGQRRLDANRSEWLEHFTTGLGKILAGRFWSGALLLAAEETSTLSALVAWLESAVLDQKIVRSSRPLKIETLSSEALQRLIAIDAPSIPNLPLLLGAIFYAKIETSK